jgi:L-amino acid N-acyltransferase YncA
MSTSRENNEISLQTGGPELVNQIEPLWLQLRQHHADRTTVWRTSLLDVSFDARRARLLAKASQGMLIVLATTAGVDVGYCVSTIDKQIGEVDSIFVTEKYRRHGLGHSMMLRTMDWFNEKTVKTIVVDILDGNEAAQAFYATYGFHPRAVRLQKTNE